MQGPALDRYGGDVVSRPVDAHKGPGASDIYRAARVEQPSLGRRPRDYEPPPREYSVSSRLDRRLPERPKPEKSLALELFGAGTVELPLCFREKAPDDVLGLLTSLRYSTSIPTSFPVAIAYIATSWECDRLNDTAGALPRALTKGFPPLP